LQPKRSIWDGKVDAFFQTGDWGLENRRRLTDWERFFKSKNKFLGPQASCLPLAGWKPADSGAGKMPAFPGEKNVFAIHLAKHLLDFSGKIDQNQGKRSYFPHFTKGPNHAEL